MRIILQLVLLILFSATAFSQIDKSASKSVDLKTDAEYIKLTAASHNMPELHMTTISLSAVPEYFGLDAKLVSLFLDEKIPQSCPYSNGCSDKSKYISVLNDWLKKNQNLIKVDKKNTLITE